jgi:predicted site-specific integrase-resolvase
MSKDESATNRRPARRLYRRATAAEILDTSITMMKRLEREGRLTPVRLGGRDVFYPADEVHRLADGR